MREKELLKKPQKLQEQELQQKKQENLSEKNLHLAPYQESLQIVQIKILSSVNSLLLRVILLEEQQNKEEIGEYKQFFH